MIKRTSLVIDEKLLNVIDSYAKQERRNRSQQINLILEEWVNAKYN